jgi:diguanylate cyclase (GGDEF)-like protein
MTMPMNSRASEAVDLRDCEHLIDTVRSSLWGLLDVPGEREPPAQPPANDTGWRVRSNALQGTLALAQLHTTLAQEFAVRDALLREIGEARGELERVRQELAGTQVQALQARHRASHDALTELPNRACFHDRLAHLLATAEPQSLAVLFLDLDGFKPINDTHGHAAGDELLRIVARRLARAMRREDMVGRLGGDEFACLLGGLATRAQALFLATKLRHAVQAPCQIGDCVVSVGVSIGVAVCPDDGSSADELLLKADMAMYRAKRAGEGVAFFDTP